MSFFTVILYEYYWLRMTANFYEHTYVKKRDLNRDLFRTLK